MFKREVQLAASMSWAVNMGFKELAYEMRMTSYNLFVHLNQGAFSLEDGVFVVDYSALRLSSGQRAAVAFGVPVWDEENVLTVSFDNDGSGLRADRYDNVYLYAYCPDRESGFMASPVYRRAKKVSVALPDSFAGHEVHLYGMVCSADGMWSETVYAGCVEMNGNEELRVKNEKLDGDEPGVKQEEPKGKRAKGDAVAGSADKNYTPPPSPGVKDE